ncbi:oligosaccharide flippase family protein [Mesonia sediminis]|uniref:Oligosaccharide flippase family protein n=1 Tax=Mesonia sediminis TaxID=1703946 RepID=A0ABW5SFB7_9FLAO
MAISENKRIAKNTLFLYLRMFLTMAVGLYTSRLVLEALGAVDYGIYGLVGGIVTMFAFLNSAMSSATQRYLSFDIGRNDIQKLQETFNATLNIHFLVALIILLLSETIGLWFVNYKLDIPPDRMIAANWVFQFSVFTFILNVIQVPYNALLIAREHMNVYAYVSILETLLKLIIVLYLVQADSDRLILYAILTFAVSFIIRMAYKIYCKKKFKESIYKFYYDKTYYKELLSYSGWNLFGNIAAVARSQGSNILLNLFFGPIANAAYSLTLMVQGIINNFISNFQTAVNPQIVKNYSKGDKQASLNLMFKSAKFSYFGMLILIVPLLVNIDYVINLWLKEVPKYTTQFIQLALIYSLIETIANPLMSVAQATGKIKWYQIIIGSFIFLTLPVVWIVFKLTNEPVNVYWVLISNSIFALIFRVLFLVNMIGLSIKNFMTDVIFRVIIVSIIIYMLFTNYQFDQILNLVNFILRVGAVGFITIGIIILLGITKNEKKMLFTILKKQLFKIKE